MSFDLSKSAIQASVRVSFDDGFTYPPTTSISKRLQATQRFSADDPRLAVSVEEACRLLSIGRTSVFALLRNKDLTSFRSGRRRLILRESILRYIEAQLSKNDNPNAV